VFAIFPATQQKDCFVRSPDEVKVSWMDVSRRSNAVFEEIRHGDSQLLEVLSPRN